MHVRVLCCVVAWMPLRIREATGLPVCVASIIIIIIIECGKRKPSPASSLSSQQPLAGSPRDPLPRSLYCSKCHLFGSYGTHASVFAY